jgi:hypothetical protein
MTSNNMLDPLQLIFGFQEEYLNRSEVFFTKDGCLKSLCLLKGWKNDIKSLTKILVMKDHK